MISRTDQSAAATTRRLSDLQRAQPADATLRNLLGVLSAKLELCSRLPVFEWEADNEGYAGCAAAFHTLADAERRSCADVIETLRSLLEQRAAVAGTDAT